MMTTVGFLLFDNIASKLIFGIAVGGGIFGWIFITNKTNKNDNQWFLSIFDYKSAYFGDGCVDLIGINAIFYRIC